MRYRYLLDCVSHGQPTPVCPVGMWRHHPVADQSAAALADATIAFQNRFDFDFAKITPASTYQLRDYGLSDALLNDALGRRAATAPVILHADDWYGLPRLDPAEGFAGQIVQCAKRVRRGLPPHVPVLMTVFNPLFQAVTLAGLPALRQHIEQQPEAVFAGLAVIADNTRRLIETFCDAGVDGIFLAVQQAQASQFSAADYRRYGLEHDRACLETAALPLNMVHLHGAAVHGDLFGAHAPATIHYEADNGNPDPADLLSLYGYGVSTGPAAGLLAPHRCATELARCIDDILDRCKGPGFILGAGCALPLAAAADRIDATVARARVARRDRPTLAEVRVA
jgi:uroporphyrinogen decarboxylase